METSTSAYPLQLTGELSPQLSRGLWLVKWLLAIPHFIVLVVLWIAFAVVSVVAFFAVLFPSRYPRGLFEFNVRVLRWTWRVGFYSYSALGTDTYPPFTLKDTPDSPPRLPSRLIRVSNRVLPTSGSAGLELFAGPARRPVSRVPRQIRVLPRCAEVREARLKPWRHRSTHAPRKSRARS